MPDAILLLVNLILLTLKKVVKNERMSRIFVSFQDCLSLCASQELFSSPKLTSSHDFVISIAAVFLLHHYFQENLLHLALQLMKIKQIMTFLSLWVTE